MTDLDLMTDQQVAVMACLAVAAWGYLVGVAWLRHRARRRSTYQPPKRYHY